MVHSSTIAQDAALLETIDPTSTMDLHRSNLMRLQTTELLQECQLDLTTRKWSGEAQEYLQVIGGLVESMSIGGWKEEVVKQFGDKTSVLEIHKNNNNDNNSFSVVPIGCTKTPIGWTKPSGNAQLLPTFHLMVLMPKEIIHSKDYMNYRYLDKRNAVLDRIAKHLVKSQKKVGQVDYQWPQVSSGAPRLRLVPPSKKKSPKYQVYLHVGMETIDWIPALRLVPNRVNNTKTHAQHHAQLYNHTLLHDAARHLFEDPHLVELQEHPNIQATMVLVQIWALQRGLWRNHDGWSPESVGLFLLYLLRTQKMNPRMTPVQIFTVVLQTWATTNWLGDLKTTTTANNNNKEEENTVRAAHTQASTWSNSISSTTANARRTVLVLPLEDSTEKETMQESELARLYQKQTKDSPLTENDPKTLVEAYASTQSYTLGPVFLDPTMTYNYLGGVSNNYMKLMQAKAVKSLERLQSRNAFGHLFMKPARFWSQWDLYVQIPALPKGDWEDSTRKLVATLELALGNRIHGMRVLSTGNGEIDDDADEIPTRAVDAKGKTAPKRSQSPVGTNMIVLGMAINPETSQRAVDRGPPSDHSQEVKDFVKLWGAKAQLRRFKDGAIVQAIVWNDTPGQFQNEDRLKGGIVERVVRHIVQVHHTKDDIKFSLPDLVSTIDGVATQDKSAAVFADPAAAQRNIMKVFDSLSTFLRTNSQQTHPGSKEKSKLGLPLTIDGVEALSPSLRYSELFPPVPHPFLGGASTSEKKVAGVLVSDPILIQVRFGASSKWPTDLKAMGAAKAAMLIQLANGIEAMGEDGFEGRITVTPSYAELGYKGYCFRILVRADPEIKMLQGLQNPSQEAAALLKNLTRKHLVASRHHATIHGVHTLHPSAGAVVRMAKRWVSSHLLSGLISVEIIELMVANVYTDVDYPVNAPSTVAAGFLRFLRLLATHDWARDPLIVNPRDHINDDDQDEIISQFEKARGKTMDVGPPMYIVAPYDRKDQDEDEQQRQKDTKWASEGSWAPSISSPEWVVVSRAAALAKRSHDFLKSCVKNFDDTDWSAAFHETPSSFQSYSVLLRVDPDFVIDSDSSSTGGDLGVVANKDGILESAYTRSMRVRFLGPKMLRRKLYRNLRGADDESVLMSWRPVESMVEALREKLGPLGLFFYNDLSPEVVALLWRPQVFDAMPLSVMASDYVRPADEGDWKSDGLVLRNAGDMLREVSQYSQNIVTTVKIFDDRTATSSRKRRKLTHGSDEEEEEDSA